MAIAMPVKSGEGGEEPSPTDIIRSRFEWKRWDGLQQNLERAKVLWAGGGVFSEVHNEKCRLADRRG